MNSLSPRFTGVLTDCITGEDKIVLLRAVVEDGEFKLFGGPTGYEGFKIDTFLDCHEEMFEHGWCACIGTPGVWDKLVVPGYEMLRILNLYFPGV